MERVIRVLVVDDHPVVADGTARLLGAEPDIEVVADVRTVDDALDAIERHRPDVVISDVMFGDEPAGLDLPRIATQRGVPTAVVFLSSYDTPWFYTVAITNGAAGYLPKTVPVHRLVDAVRRAAAGEATFPVAALRPPAPNVPRPPSERERQIIRLVAHGAANGEVGLALGVSERTVESHLSHLFRRYDIASRTELVVYALRQGWIVAAELTSGRSGG